MPDKPNSAWEVESETPASGWEVESDAPQDLTKGQGGTYKMYGFLNPTDKQAGVYDIPYSNIPAAQGRLSFNLPGGQNPSQAQYEKDKAAEGQEPSIWGTLWDKTQKALTPKADTETVATQHGHVVVPTGQMDNTDRAFFRTVLSIPGWLGDTAQKWWMTTGSRGGSVNDFLDNIDPGALPAGVYNQFKADWQSGNHKLALDNLKGTLAGVGAAGLAAHAAPKALGKIPFPGKEGFRNTVRESLGVPENTEKVVGKFGKESESTRGANVRADELTLKKRGAVDINNTRKVRTHLRTIQKVTEENQQAYDKWDTERTEVDRNNNEVRGKLDLRSRSEARLEDASRELESRYDSAEKKAKAEDDAAWNTWRKKVANVNISADSIVDTIKDQKKSMDPEDVAEFRKILKETAPEEDQENLRDQFSQDAFGTTYDKLTDNQKALVDKDWQERGFDPDAKEQPKEVNGLRLHVWKTQLEYAVRKATRGNVRFAIGEVLDNVRNAENELSVKAGADAELLRARELHGPFMDAFRNSPNEPATAASRAFQRTTPKYARAQETAGLVSRAAKYDPKIQDLTTEINQLNATLKDLPAAKTLQKQIKDAPAMPTPKDLPTDRELREKMHDYPEPEGTKSLPDAPDVQAENARFIDKQLRKYGRVGAWVARLVIGSATAGITHGDVSHLASNLFLGEVGLKVLTRVLRSPSVLEFLSKPSAEDMQMINTLPPADAARLRAALGVLYKEEARNNPGRVKSLPIAPVMAAWMAGQAAGTEQKRQQQ